jgi:hypothetical protein
MTANRVTSATINRSAGDSKEQPVDPRSPSAKERLAQSDADTRALFAAMIGKVNIIAPNIATNAKSLVEKLEVAVKARTASNPAIQSQSAFGNQTKGLSSSDRF